MAAPRCRRRCVRRHGTGLSVASNGGKGRTPRFRSRGDPGRDGRLLGGRRVGVGARRRPPDLSAHRDARRGRTGAAHRARRSDLRCVRGRTIRRSLRRSHGRAIRVGARVGIGSVRPTSGVARVRDGLRRAGDPRLLDAPTDRTSDAATTVHRAERMGDDPAGHGRRRRRGRDGRGAHRRGESTGRGTRVRRTRCGGSRGDRCGRQPRRPRAGPVASAYVRGIHRDGRDGDPTRVRHGGVVERAPARRSAFPPGGDRVGRGGVPRPARLRGPVGVRDGRSRAAVASTGRRRTAPA